MTIQKFIVGISIGFLAALITIGGLCLWYIIDDTSLCQKYEKANPSINFEWGFSTGCIFELPDGTWVNLRVYKNQKQYELEIEVDT